jgi:hypothetical protein
MMVNSAVLCRYLTVYKTGIGYSVHCYQQQQVMRASTARILGGGRLLIYYQLNFIFSTFCASLVVFRVGSPSLGRAAFTRLLLKYR